MKKKIFFVTPHTSTPHPGISARCGKKNTHGIRCRNAMQHTGPHAFTETPSKAKRREQRERIQPKSVSRDTRLSCLEMIEDPQYRRQLLRDLRARNLRPAVECMLWYYAKGKPKEMVEHSGTLSLQQELSTLTAEELQARALDVAKMLGPAHGQPPKPTRLM